MAYVNSPLDLAKCIVGMSYSGLMDVASELVRMNREPDAGRDVGTDHGMADTLSNWAEAVAEEAEIEERMKKERAASIKAA